MKQEGTFQPRGLGPRDRVSHTGASLPDVCHPFYIADSRLGFRRDSESGNRPRIVRITVFIRMEIGFVSVVNVDILDWWEGGRGMEGKWEGVVLILLVPCPSLVRCGGRAGRLSAYVLTQLKT